MNVPPALHSPLRLAAFALSALCIHPPACPALTVNESVTAAYVRAHPREFSITATRDEGGLVKFIIIRTLAAPKYLVAHLALRHDGKVIATSDTPAFGKKHGNAFYFSVALESIADADFELSESAFFEQGDEAVPLPGAIIYQFHLRDFPPTALLPATLPSN